MLKSIFVFVLIPSSIYCSPVSREVLKQIDDDYQLELKLLHSCDAHKFPLVYHYRLGYVHGVESCIEIIKQDK